MTSPPQPPAARRHRTRALTLLGAAVVLGAVPGAAHAGPRHAASPGTPTTSSATAADPLEYSAPPVAPARRHTGVLRPPPRRRRPPEGAQRAGRHTGREAQPGRSRPAPPA